MAQRSGESQRRSGVSEGSASRGGGGPKSRKGGQARGRQQQARRAAGETTEAATKPVETAGVSGKSVAEVRNALRDNLVNPLNLVLLTRDRIEEVVDEAVSRGRITANDAQEMVQSLLSRGRKQTNDVLNNLESLLERGGSGIATGVGPSFPITDYDNLTAAQVRERLGTLNAGELREVRDHERRHANRKTVLAAIESKLD